MCWCAGATDRQPCWVLVSLLLGLHCRCWLESIYLAVMMTYLRAILSERENCFIL